MKNTTALKKARDARSRKARSALWQEVKRRRKEQGCTCELRPGMSARELIELGSGCTGAEAMRARGRVGGWVCPVLDFYRTTVRRSAA